MKYFITENERTGTCYHEWQKGHFDGVSFWRNDSLLLHEDMHYKFHLEEIFKILMPHYNPCGEVEVSKTQWVLILKKADEIGGDVAECIHEADIWAKETFEKYEVFTMIGM